MCITWPDILSNERVSTRCKPYPCIGYITSLHVAVLACRTLEEIKAVAGPQAKLEYMLCDVSSFKYADHLVLLTTLCVMLPDLLQLHMNLLQPKSIVVRSAVFTQQG